VHEALAIENGRRLPDRTGLNSSGKVGAEIRRGRNCRDVVGGNGREELATTGKKTIDSDDLSKGFNRSKGEAVARTGPKAWRVKKQTHSNPRPRYWNAGSGSLYCTGVGWQIWLLGVGSPRYT
jgi:hypothetical protein